MQKDLHLKAEFMLYAPAKIIIKKIITAWNFNDFDDGNLCNSISLRQIFTFPTH